MSFNIQTADARDNFRNAAHIIAQSNSLFKKDATGAIMKDKNGNPIPDISQIDLQQLTQGYLALSCNVNPQTQQLQFTVVDTQQVSNSPVTPMNRLLSMQDSFIVGSMSYFLSVYWFTGNQQNPNFTVPNYWTPYTYPSPTHDNQEFGPGFQIFDPGMSLFWSSGAYISVEIDKKTVIPYWDCLKHLYVPKTQANGQCQAILGPPNQWPQLLDQYDGSTDAYFPVEPTIVLGGGRQNIIKLNLPANVPATIAPFNYPGYGDSFYVQANLIMHGILAQNSTSVK